VAKIKKRRGPGRPPKSRGLKPETVKAIVVIVCFALALVGIMGFFEGAGALGSFSRNLTGMMFGWGGFLFPILLIFIGIAVGWGSRFEWRFMNYLGVAILLLSLLGIFQLPIADEGSLPISEGRGGGAVGYIVGVGLSAGTGIVAAWIILIALLLIGFLLTFNISFKTVCSCKVRL